MLGTSYLGASMVWGGILQGFFHAVAGTPQYILTLATAAGGFYIQWFKTSKGVEIDPKTGQVTVVILLPPPPGMGAPLRNVTSNPLVMYWLIVTLLVTDCF